MDYKDLDSRDKAQYDSMAQFQEDFDDYEDGAFFALAEDIHGWDVGDWAWFSEVDEPEEECKHEPTGEWLVKEGKSYAVCKKCGEYPTSLFDNK